MNGFRHRTYRQRASGLGLPSFRVVCQETDLMIQADRLLDRQAHEQVLVCRGHIDGYIERFPEFATTLVPWREASLAPEIVRQMIQAGRAAGVGPMAAVAGAISEAVGRALLRESRQVVVENGGDLFVCTDGPVVVGVFAGKSPMSMKIGIRVAQGGPGIGICTSSGTVGHSLSAGRADAVCVVSPSCALADAAATAIGNRIHSPKDIRSAIAFGRQIVDVLGILVIVGRQMGAWGAVELVPLAGKKG
ncbi:MAG: UPF0280 family protein [Desulfosarcina sp.]